MTARVGAETCRACLGADLSLVVALGEHPLANAFLTEGELALPEPKYPLDLFVCERCALLQIPNVVPPGYFRNYLYVPSAADAGRRHFADFARWLVDRRLASPGALVVDVGCNDGLFLSACRALGLRTLGIDPASNLTMNGGSVPGGMNDVARNAMATTCAIACAMSVPG